MELFRSGLPKAILTYSHLLLWNAFSLRAPKWTIRDLEYDGDFKSWCFRIELLFAKNWTNETFANTVIKNKKGRRNEPTNMAHLEPIYKGNVVLWKRAIQKDMRWSKLLLLKKIAAYFFRWCASPNYFFDIETINNYKLQFRRWNLTWNFMVGIVLFCYFHENW